jgi:hypothetical protein
MDNPLLHEAMLEQPAILDIFGSINGELDLFEQLCLCAMSFLWNFLVEKTTSDTSLVGFG